MTQLVRKQFTLAQLTKNTDIKIQGDPNCIVSGVCTLQEGSPDQIAFLMNPLYKKFLATTDAAAVILTAGDADECPANALISGDPYYAYTQIAKYFDDKPVFAAGIHQSATIGKNCVIAPCVTLGPNVVIGDGVKLGERTIIAANCVIGEYSQLGEDCRLEPNVILYHKTQLHNRVQIGSGTVIGSDGFGIAKHKGQWHKVPQLGTVVIEDDVEIGANCAIDRGAIDNTVIERGVKLDNLIQIAHNVRIGQHTAIAGCVGIAGSTTIGSNCLIGGGSGFAGHLTIANNVVITGMTAVTKSIAQPGIYSSGVGGVSSNLEWRKNSARLHRLDNLMKRVKALEAALKESSERESL
jgi:UDP-3-O-[3-hydroxymyristoyl] glucosamine N-acyltransferase